MDFEGGLGEDGGCVRFGVVGWCASGDKAKPVTIDPDPEFGLVLIEGYASAAGGHHNASPVGITARKCGFHERRNGDGVGDGVGGFVIHRPRDGDFDKFGRPFAVAHDFVG